MTDFFYSLPIWLAGILVLALAVAVGLGSSIGVHRVVQLKPTDEEKEIAINLMQVVAAYIGIMLACSGVAVWQNFADADTAVHQEAASAAELYRDLTTYGAETQATRSDLRDLCCKYPQGRVAGSSRRLKRGDEAALSQMFVEVKLNPQSNRDSAIYAESFSKLNDLVVLRRNRIIASQAGIPLILWIVGLVGSTLTISYASAFSRTRYNLIVISGASIAIGLVFLFILMVDRPFKGEFSVQDTDLAHLAPTFDRLDRMVSAKSGGVDFAMSPTAFAKRKSGSNELFVSTRGSTGAEVAAVSQPSPR